MASKSKLIMPLWVCIIWPIATLALLIFFGFHFKATTWMWVSSLIVYLGGDAYEAYQLRSDLDTTMSPYWLEFAAVALMGTLAATQPLVFTH